MPDTTHFLRHGAESMSAIVDRLVAEYSDLVTTGVRPDRDAFLARAPLADREALRACLDMIDAGLGAGSTGSPAVAATLPAGFELDGLRIERVLGRGGMATVYLAEELELRRSVALKVLRPGLALDPRHVERFRREALAIARVKHPNIVAIHRVGQSQGYHYIAMEHIAGSDLSEIFARLADGPRTARRLAEAASVPSLAAGDPTLEEALGRLLAPVARAVAAAHALGIVHRDLKPSNILLRRSGEPVVVDFGLALALEDPALSLAGEVLGTPYYMSPEQVRQRGQRVDFRTDIYSLGVILFEGIAGRRPFEGDTIAEVLRAIDCGPLLSLASCAPSSTRDSRAVVRRALDRSPERRFESAEDLASDLERLAHGTVTDARIREGGAIRRGIAALRRGAESEGYEFRSERTFLGLPLVHIVLWRKRRGRPRVAKGWIAIGDVAVGGLAFGGLSLGGLTFGGLSLGLLLGFGGLATGGVAFGGCAVGGCAGGGVAVGGLAFGGLAVGHTAVGGFAAGRYAIGGDARGSFVISGKRRDPEAIEYFETHFPGVVEKFLRRRSPERP